MITKLRPQVLAAIVCATLIAIVALFIGMQMAAVEVVTAVIGAVFGFLAGVAFKVLENE
jgi:hypothetical protein